MNVDDILKVRAAVEGTDNMRATIRKLTEQLAAIRCRAQATVLSMNQAFDPGPECGACSTCQARAVLDGGDR